MLWTQTGGGMIDTDSPNPQGHLIEGIQLFLKTPVTSNHFKHLLIDKNQIPEIKREGVRVRIVSGKSDNMCNSVVTPKPLTLLHIYLEKGKTYKHILPAKWTGSLTVIEGRMDFSTNEETVELEEGQVISFGNSEELEPLLFMGITSSEIIGASSMPALETVQSQGSVLWNLLSF